jgi:hypothetical protein
MATSSSSSLPFVGSWKLYFHDPSNTSWQEKDYISISTPITSLKEYWVVMKAISDIQFEQGGFFLMKEGYPPLYENKHNKRGGAYQIQLSKLDDNYRMIFDEYCIAMIQEKIANDTTNKIIGVSISSKREHYILKLWNIDASIYNRITDIPNYVKPTTSIVYASHIGRTYN